MTAGCANSTRNASQNSVVKIDSRTGEPGRYVNLLDASAAPVVWARAGERLLIPVTPTEAQIAEGSMTARLDRGDTLYAPLYQLQVEEGDGSPHWLSGFSPDLGAKGWRVVPADQAKRGASDAALPWFVSVDMPRNGAGQGLWLASRRVPIGWMLEPPYQPTPTASAAAALASHHAELQALLAPALGSPFTRWRARLALTLAGVPDANTIGTFNDVLVESLATQIEGEWNIGLMGLSAADAALAQRIRERLGGLVVIAPSSALATSRVAVVWNPDPVAIEPLKQLLLSASLRGDERVMRAREWLDADPTALAWVMDDAGSVDAQSSRLLSTIGLMNLPGTVDRSAVFVAPPENGTSPAVSSIGPGEMTTLPVAGDRTGRGVGELEGGFGERLTESGRARRGTLVASVGIGEWRAPRLIAARPTPVLPPGKAIGPLLADWTLPTWWTSAQTKYEHALVNLTPPNSQTVAMLMRDQREERAGGSGWMLYVECREVKESTPGQFGDVVRVWLGPLNAPLGVIEVQRDGTFETKGAASLGTEVRVSTWVGKAGETLRTSVRTGDDAMPDTGKAGASAGESSAVLTPRSDEHVGGWSAWIQLPKECIETSDGSRTSTPSALRLGIERMDAHGERSAWPRPMLPWQNEPGRIWIDLSQWTTVH